MRVERLNIVQIRTSLRVIGDCIVITCCIHAVNLLKDISQTESLKPKAESRKRHWAISYEIIIQLSGRNLCVYQVADAVTRGLEPLRWIAIYFFLAIPTRLAPSITNNEIGLFEISTKIARPESEVSTTYLRRLLYRVRIDLVCSTEERREAMHGCNDGSESTSSTARIITETKIWILRCLLHWLENG